MQYALHIGVASTELRDDLEPGDFLMRNVIHMDQERGFLAVGDELRQKSNTSMLIFDTRRLVEYGSSFYTLYPGDVIMTGTPEGVGPVQPGDVMHCWAEKIGRMDVPVRAA